MKNVARMVNKINSPLIVNRSNVPSQKMGPKKSYQKSVKIRFKFRSETDTETKNVWNFKPYA